MKKLSAQGELIDADLSTLHKEIDRCRVCAGHAQGFRKPPHLDRGGKARVMIVGKGPGNAELQGNRAFAGQSGHTLDSWLRSSGADRTHPRRGLYLTSIIKCCHLRMRDFDFMARNCAPFLQQQIEKVRPELIVTLGGEAYMGLRFTAQDYDRALCNPVNSADHLLFSPFGFHFWLLPWPHPSGLNRWHNSLENKERLRRSFAFLRQVLEGDSGKG